MLRAAPRVPAGITSLAAIYERASDLEKSLDEVATNAPQMRNALITIPLDSIAIGVMVAPPTSIADITLTLTIAASWMGFVADAIEEARPQHKVGLAISGALENAILILSEIEDLDIEGDALDLLNRTIAEISHTRAAIVEARP